MIVTPGILAFPSIEVMIIVLPEEDGPNSLERSPPMIRTSPQTVISTIFIVVSPNVAPSLSGSGFKILPLPPRENRVHH